MKIHRYSRNFTCAASFALVLNLFSQPVFAAAKPSIESRFCQYSADVPNVQPSKSISLSDCFHKSDNDNKEIVVARKNILIAEGQVRAAGAVCNPVFQLQTGFGPSFTKLFTGQTQQIGWTEEIQTAGKRSKKLNLAKANYQLALLQLDSLRFSIHNQARRAYAELAASEAYADLIESERAVAEKLVVIAKNRFQAGKAPGSEALQAELTVMQFDTQRNQAKGRLQKDTAALSLLMGDKPEHVEVIDVEDNGIFKLSAEKTSIVPSPNMVLPPLDKLFEVAFSLRPDLKAAEQQVFVARRALTLVQAQRIPELFLGGGYTFSTFSQNQPTGLPAEPNWLGQGAFMSVSMENPIFYQHQGEVHQARGLLRQSERQLDLLKAQAQTDIVVAYNEVSVASANIFKFQKDLLPTAAESARMARRGYQFGATGLSTAIVAQQQYQQILANYFDAVVSYQNAWADLEQAVGVPLRI